MTTQLLRHERWDEALARARACKLPRAELDALAALGEFAAAAQLLPRVEMDWPLREGEIAIAAGEWTQAAEIAAAIAKAKTQYDDSSDAATFAAGEVHRYECLAELFRFHAGDAAAAARLRAHAEQPLAEACLPIAAVTMPPAERVAYLTPMRDLRSGASLAETKIALVLWSAGSPMWPHRTPSLHDGARGLFRDDLDARQWLAPLAVAALEPDGDSPTLAEALAFHALLEVQLGDLDRARATAREAIETSPIPLGEYEARYAKLLIAGIELHGPSTAAELPPDLLYSEPLALRRGDNVDLDSTVYGYSDCDEERHAAVVAAQAGDGRPLARILQGCGFYWIGATAHALIAVLPRVTTGRDELATALRYFRDDIRHHVLDQARYASIRRDMMRLAGDDAEAARWQAIVDRHAAVIADPARLFALLLWEL